MGDQFGPNTDQGTTHDQRPENAPKKDAMLVLGGDAEEGKDPAR